MKSAVVIKRPLGSGRKTLTRSSKKNALIGQSLARSFAETAGAFDALREKRAEAAERDSDSEDIGIGPNPPASGVASNRPVVDPEEESSESDGNLLPSPPRPPLQARAATNYALLLVLAFILLSACLPLVVGSPCSDSTPLNTLVAIAADDALCWATGSEPHDDCASFAFSAILDDALTTVYGAAEDVRMLTAPVARAGLASAAATARDLAATLRSLDVPDFDNRRAQYLVHALAELRRRSLRSARRALGWLRDLLAEGIEPNPGPGDVCLGNRLPLPAPGAWVFRAGGAIIRSCGNCQGCRRGAPAVAYFGPEAGGPHVVFNCRGDVVAKKKVVWVTAYLESDHSGLLTRYTAGFYLRTGRRAHKEPVEWRADAVVDDTPATTPAPQPRVVLPSPRPRAIVAEPLFGVLAQSSAAAALYGSLALLLVVAAVVLVPKPIYGLDEAFTFVCDDGLGVLRVDLLRPLDYLRSLALSYLESPEVLGELAPYLARNLTFEVDVMEVAVATTCVAEPISLRATLFVVSLLLLATLALQRAFPALSEVVEEVFSHLPAFGPVFSLLMDRTTEYLVVTHVPGMRLLSISAIYRYFLVLVEGVSLRRRGFFGLTILFLCALHVLWFMLPFHYALLSHVAYNGIIAYTTRFHNWSEAIDREDLYGTTGAPEHDYRTYDNRVGNVEYANPITKADLLLHVDVYLSVDFGPSRYEIHIGTLTSGEYDVPFSRELERHLRSYRTIRSATDEPGIILSRLKQALAAFSTLGADRSIIAPWASNTLDYVYRSVLHERNPLTAPPAKQFLYGAVAETIERFTPAPTDFVPFRLSRGVAALFPSDNEARPVAQQIFPAPYALPKCDPSDVPTAIEGIKKRNACILPQAREGVLERYKAFVQRFIEARKIRPIPPDADLTEEAWLESKTYPENRKEQLRIARGHAPFRYRVPAKQARAKSFIKDEPYRCFKWPRLISSRPDAYKAWVGPVVSAMEKITFALPEFIKKVPANSRAALVVDVLEPLPGRLIATDYTSFEAVHVRELLYASVGVLYRHLTSRNPHARKIVNEHLRVRSGRQVLRFRDFTVRLGRAILLSGEMDTSLNNGWVNLTLMYFLASERAAAAGQTFDLARQYGFFEGDDGLCKFPEAWVPTTDDFASAGTICKVDLPDSLDTASFCGNIIDRSTATLVTDVTSWLGKFPFTSKRDANASPRRVLALRQSKAMSAAFQYNGCPVVSPVAWAFLRRFGVPDRTFILNDVSFDEYQREVALQALDFVSTHPERPVADSSRALVEKLYGIDAAEQLRLESLVPALPYLARYDVGFALGDNAASVAHYTATHYDAAPHRPARAPARRVYTGMTIGAGWVNEGVTAYRGTHAINVRPDGVSARFVYDPLDTYGSRDVPIFACLLLSSLSLVPSGVVDPEGIPSFPYRPLSLLQSSGTRQQLTNSHMSNAEKSKKQPTLPANAAAVVRATRDVVRSATSSVAAARPAQASVVARSVDRALGRLDGAARSSQRPKSAGDGSRQQSRPAAATSRRVQHLHADTKRARGRPSAPSQGLGAPVSASAWRPTARHLARYGPSSRYEFEQRRARQGVEAHGVRDGVVVSRAPVKFVRNTVPLVSASTYEGSAPAEHRWTENGSAPGFHTSIAGTQFLSTISTGASVGVGARLPGGTQVISPEALGGRLAALAKQYEFHRFTHLRVLYKTIVDAATPGALMMYYRQDVGTATDTVGITELEHASTHYGNCLQTPVWKDATHRFQVIDVVDAYSNSSDDAYLSAQGILFVEDAGGLVANTDYGNLYIEYACEFYGSESDYNVSAQLNGTALFTYNAATSTLGEPIYFPCISGAPASGAVGVDITNAPSSSGYMLYGEVTAVTGSLPTYFVGNEDGSRGINVGDCFWIALDTTDNASDFSNGSIVMSLYNDYASCGALAYHSSNGGDIDQEGVMRYSGSATYSGTFTMSWKVVPISSS